MRITVVTETLRNAVNAARRFAQVKSSVPILGTLLFKTDADGVTIGSHSLDCCLSVRVPAEVMSPGTVALSAEKVSGLLRAAAGVEVSIDAGNTTAVIRTGSRSRYTIPIFIADDFPPMLALKDSTPGVDLDPVAVATLLVPTIAISNDESRHWLCGLYLHSTAENKVAAVATDGFKLVMGTTDVDGDAFQGLPLNGLHKGVILPAMALGEIARLSKNAIINVATDGRVIQVHAGATIFTSKLVAGTYPAYERVIPPSSSTTATVETMNLIAALRRLLAAATASDKDKPICGISWAAGDGGIRLEDEHDTAADEIIAEVEGATTVGFPAGQFADLLEAMPAQRVKLSATGPGNPLRIDVVDGNKSVTALQMPSTRWRRRAAA